MLHRHQVTLESGDHLPRSMLQPRDTPLAITRLPSGGGKPPFFIGVGQHTARHQLMVLLWDLLEQGKYENAQKLNDAIDKLLHGHVLPLYTSRHLQDSTLDRLMRQQGGGDVGLRCQLPYRSATSHDLSAMHDFCQEHAPLLLVKDRQALLEQLQAPLAKLSSAAK